MYLLTITDTAGIRDTPSDEIEAIGIKKAINELKKADLVLFMIDGSSEAPDATGHLRENPLLRRQSGPYPYHCLKE